MKYSGGAREGTEAPSPQPSPAEREREIGKLPDGDKTSILLLSLLSLLSLLPLSIKKTDHPWAVGIVRIEGAFSGGSA